VYCLRGGMRSHSFADLLSAHGFEVFLLSGGYKSYRNVVLPSFYHCPSLIVLGGTTGSGKTEMLHRLADTGTQVLDLEGLARHKGSVFGGMSEEKQPTTQQFENLLFEAWRRLDPAKPVIVEDENHDIGSVKVPHVFWLQIRRAPMIRLDVPLIARLQYLVSIYANKQDELLIRGVWRIEQRLGNAMATQAEKAILEKDYPLAAAILLNYYDKYYLNSIEKRKSASVFPVQLSGQQTAEEVESLTKLIADIHQNYKYSSG
jgi:tRNA 2-selenouridine synthase